MDKGFEAIQGILADLELESPDNIEVNYFDNTRENSVAAFSKDEHGTQNLHLYPTSLAYFFLRYIGAKNQSLKIMTLKDFEATMAHELYHMFHHKRFPQFTHRERQKEYWDRRYEYAARLYSLRWLRKQKPQSTAEHIGLWLARADVMIGQLSLQNHVRDEINAIFGVRKPGIKDHLQAIFTTHT